MKSFLILSTALLLSISGYAKNVTLTLYANGCEAANVITCSAGQQVRINAYAKYGNHFTQWSDGNTDNPRSVVLTKDATFEAQFSKDMYTVTWIADGVINTTNIEHGLLSFPADPAKCEGSKKVFLGWTKQTYIQLDGSDLVLATADDSVTTDVTYYAVYAIKKDAEFCSTGDILWAEDFSHFGTKKPSEAGIGSGTTVYHGATITYNQTSDEIKGYNENYAGGTAPELLIKKGEYEWIISGIPTGNAEELTLTYLSNNSHSTVSCLTEGASISGSSMSYTISPGEASSITLKFVNKSFVSNTRIDNVLLQVAVGSLPFVDYSMSCGDVSYFTITTSVKNSGGFTMGDTTLQAGEVATIQAIANYGYQFTRWNDGNTSNPRQVQVTGDKTYTAQFTKNTYSITKIANSKYGSIAGSSSSSYLDKVTISATANDGYHFSQWSDGNIDNPRSFILTQDTTFEALFAKNIYTITTATDDPNHGITLGDTVVEYLETISILATANYGYHFVKWNDGNTSNPRQVKVTGDKTYTAQFDKNTYYITKIANSTCGSIAGSSSSSYLDKVTISATVNDGYHFSQWSDGNTENPRSFILTQDTTFEALFAKNVYSITTAVNDPARGVVQGDTTAEYLETISISATANYGYHFTQWNDGNTNNPRQIQVTSDRTYTAQFDKNQYSVSTTKGANITSIKGSGKYYYLDEIVLSATANSNFQFDHWSDGNSDNPRTLIVTQDTTLTAYSSKIRSGKCGDDLTWLYNNGTLVISGNGEMYDYAQDAAPWSPLFKYSITSIVINNGCTSIGNFAFFGLSNKNLKTLELPNSIEKIGQYAFANCAYLKNLTLNKALEKISASAFAGDERLLYITCFAKEPPLLDESAFENYDVYLNVPCEAQDEYKVAKGWKKFNKDNVSCIGADNTSITNDGVSVEPDVNNATFTWPNNSDANSYSLEIKKDGEVFCTLIFNAQGQLTGIAFALSRDGSRQIPAAEQAANGWRFTVTGLDAASKYTYDLDVRDASEQSIKNYQGQFQTDGITGIDQLTDSPVNQFNKIIKDGHLLIQRDGKNYNAQGGEVR